MTRRVAAAALLAVAVLAASRPAPAAGITREQLDKIVAKLSANAKLWLKGEEIPAPDRVNLGKVPVDKDSVPHFEAVLKSAKRDPAGLYATGRLMARLRHADPETARSLLPAVKAVRGRARSAYRAFPPLQPRQKSSLKLPAYSPRLTTDVIMSRMAVLEKQRDVKVARDTPIARLNEAVFLIESSAISVMLRADDPKEDQLLARAAFAEERRGSALFMTILDAFDAEAKKMSPKRARRLYPVLRPQATRMAMQNQKHYANRGRAVLRRDDTSTFETTPQYAGVRIIQTLNRIAEAAKSKTMPKVKAPAAKQIQDYHAKRAASGRR